MIFFPALGDGFDDPPKVWGDSEREVDPGMVFCSLDSWRRRLATVLVYTAVNPLVLLRLVDIISSDVCDANLRVCFEDLVDFVLQDVKDFLRATADDSVAQYLIDPRSALEEIVEKLAEVDFKVAREVLGSALLIDGGNAE